MSVVSRIPAQLDPTLMKEPRALQGVPRSEAGKGKRIGRKAVPSLMPGGLGMGLRQMAPQAPVDAGMF